MKDRDNPWALIILFALLSVLPFLSVVEGPFLFDDEPLIKNNAALHSMDGVRGWFTREFWHSTVERAQSSKQAAYFRPLVLLTYALDFRVGGGSVVPFHLTNLVLAALASALAMAVLLRWLGGNTKAALFSGIVFALHPSKAESIAWISGRPDLLLMVGCTSALLGRALSLGWRLTGLVGAPRPVLGAALQWGGAAVAFLSKESAVVLPALIAAQALLFESRHSQMRIAAKGYRAALIRHGVSIGGYLLLSLSYVAARSAFLPFSGLPVGLGSFERLLLVIESWGRYAELLLVPHDLSLFGAYRPLALVSLRDSVSTVHVLLGMIHLLGVGVGLWLAYLRGHVRVVAHLVAYTACLLPVCNLIPMATDISVSPRFLYLPLFPLGALAAELFLGRAKWLSVATGFVLIAGLLSCFVRAHDFADPRAFWRYELAHHPQVPSVIGANADVDEQHGQSLLAAARRACMYTQASRAGDVDGMARALTAWVEGTIRAIPHSDRAALVRLARGLDLALDGRGYALDWSGVVLPHAASSLDVAAARARRAALLAARARLSLRLQEPFAMSFAMRAVAACSGCADIAHRAARVAIASYEPGIAAAWLEAAAIPHENLASDLDIYQLGLRLRELEPGLRALDPSASLKRALLVENNDAVVVLARSHPEWIRHVSVELRLGVARAAHQVGEAELAKKWLDGLMPQADLAAIHAELARISPARPAHPQSLPTWVHGTCARSEEL